jgi:alginate O-acetyltransferase complex protein AlgI
MLFNDPVFLFCFLPAVVCIFAVIGRGGGARTVLILLIIASVVFYGWWNPVYLPLLGGLAVFNYALAHRITAERQNQRSHRVRFLLTLGIAGDLLVLAYFKYTDLFIDTANSVLSTQIPIQHIVLPLGISFFTFQKIAYLVDASRGEVEDHDFPEYCFFVMFFPQLIAGPIVHHREIFSQIHRGGAFSPRLGHLAIGLTVLVIGLFKKVVVADRLAPVASEVFDAAAAGEPLNVLCAWQGAVAHSLQLYFDFSGYSDMAIGAARLFGIRLPVNFNSPYQSTGIIEFWQRWHMTLSRFLRVYLYIPLGGNRKGKIRRYVNLMLTMTIGGLWHGAAWTFVLWGFLHGVYLIVNHAWRLVWTPIDQWWSRAVARLVTLVSVVIAFVTFRAPDLTTAFRIYCGMIGLPQSVSSLDKSSISISRLAAHLDSVVDPSQFTRAIDWLIFGLTVLWLAPNTQQLMARFRPAFDYDAVSWRRQPPVLARIRTLQPLLCWQPTVVGAVLIGIFAALAFLSLQHVSEFLYFEF